MHEFLFAHIYCPTMEDASSIVDSGNEDDFSRHPNPIVWWVTDGNLFIVTDDDPMCIDWLKCIAGIRRIEIYPHQL
jgi:hypothetical protein